jgi:hypothetical protein
VVPDALGCDELPIRWYYGSSRIGGSGGPFDQSAPILPVSAIKPVQERTPSTLADGAIELLTQDVGVAGVADRVDEASGHDVEQWDLFSPPRHMTLSVKVERFDGCICVDPHSSIEVDDLVSGLVLCRP